MVGLKVVNLGIADRKAVARKVAMVDQRVGAPGIADRKVVARKVRLPNGNVSVAWMALRDADAGEVLPHSFGCSTPTRMARSAETS